jgi:beta-galactosidase
VIEGTVDPKLNPNHGALATNVSWYRKEFELPTSAADSLVWLTFDGVFRNADVYINGAFVKHHIEGYTSWTAYIHNASKALKFGEGQKNVVAVFVDATQPELWCYEGGGIFRHVWLETASMLSVVPWGFAFPTYVDGAITGDDATKPQTSDSALAMPQLDVQNAGPKSLSVVANFTLTDSQGKLVLNHSLPITVPAGGFRRIAPGAGPWFGPPLRFGSTTDPVLLWNTADAPPLYTAAATLLDTAGGVIDRVEATVGVRNAIFDAREGFMLNGVKVTIKGTSNHLGFGAVGLAVPDRVMEFQVATLKAMGSNAWRTAHNPAAPELLEYADRYGMLVWEVRMVHHIVCTYCYYYSHYHSY